MSYLKDSLSKDEELIALFHFHWYVWVRVVVWTLLGLITVPILIGIPMLLFAIYQAIVNKTDERGLTSRRVVSKKGIVSRNTQEMRLSAIETVEIR